MTKLLILIIPAIIGMSAGLFLVFFGEEAQSEHDSKLTGSKLIKNGSPVLGKTDAQITILEFGDYQCTFCYRFHESTLHVLNEEYIKSGKVNLVFKDFPLNGPDSMLAAEATYCAEDQEKYWEFHDELYKNWGGERTGWITRYTLNAFANTVGLDNEKFNQCIDNHKYLDRVKKHYEFGENIGIDATPSFLIFNDEKIIKIRGNQPLEVFLKTIEEL